ncbi:MAG: alpha-glucosidase [Eubacterium sp.]|nr:alpha-glucosidase [Eubacterium sp.]MBR0412179.1 alpha-glucosidase [Eubacterium sp.]
MLKINPNTTLKSAMVNPMAKDIIEKLMLALRLPADLPNKNKVFGNLKFKTLTTLTAGLLDKKTVQTICDMLNLETDEVITDEGEMVEKWWKEAIIYQIYPRSFYDSNGDGIGDLAGITQKLDYLKELGVTAIWCSPFYDSPNDDNGYDIRDYTKIMTEFGTMDDFDTLLEEIHKRDMKLIIDLVVNHTSDEHKWFTEALKSKDNPYHDYYIWRDATDGDKTPPNNWVSLFKGPAWNYYESVDQWAMHLFSKKQMDLNWENPKVRESVYEIMLWWLDKGIDGFRMDVINFISKQPDLPDANAFLGMLTGFKGAEYYFYGPKLHDYLREMREKTFGNYDVYTVGECGGAGIEMDKMLTADFRGELDTVFNFDFLINQGHTDYDNYTYDLYKVMLEFERFQSGYTNHCWPAVFFENHDNPRIVSKVDKSGAFREDISKLCVLIEMTLRGTPYIYQGQEISMANGDFESIDEIDDREAIGHYNEMIEKGKNPEKAFKRAKTGTRDNARTPFQWSDSENAGFTTGTPWLRVTSDYRRYNAEDEMARPDSVWNFYKKAIALRKNTKALIYGSFTRSRDAQKPVFCYFREYGDEKYYIELNLGSKPQKKPINTDDMELILSTKDVNCSNLRPFEGNIYRIK